MRKRGKIGGAVILIILLIGLGFSLYFLFLNISDIYAKSKVFVKNETAKTDANQTSFPSESEFQFYPNMRFNKKSIIYYVNEFCSDQKKLRTRKALTRLQEETNLLKFYKNLYSEKADILITCNESETQIQEYYFVAGEGGPTSIINASSFYIIEEGKILLLYKKSPCENYNIELHELLHVFGFKHSDNENSIMYNTTSCDQVLTLDIINELKRLYSIPELPDLTIEEVSAERHSRYLDFEIKLKNQGLIKAEKVILEIYVRGKKLYDYNFRDISYGEGKILKAENYKIPKDTKKIKFVVLAGQEINKENNEVELILSQ